MADGDPEDAIFLNPEFNLDSWNVSEEIPVPESERETIETLVDVPSNDMSYSDLYSELRKKKSWFGFGSDGENDLIRSYLLKTIFDANANISEQYVLNSNIDPEKHSMFRKNVFDLCGMNSHFKSNSSSPISLFHFVNSYGGIRTPVETAKAFVIIANSKVNSHISKVAVKEALRDSIKTRKKKHHRGRRKNKTSRSII